MKVFGLPGQIIRNARAASRLIDAKTPDIAAVIRRDAVKRWRLAMAKGLTAKEAAQAVGVPRSSLYRWQKRPQLRSKRPHRTRPKNWTPELVMAIEHLRGDHPMWGKAKIVVLLRREGFSVSQATVGRIIAHMVGRGVLESVPTLRRRKGAGARQWRRKHAIRLPAGHKPTAPGQLVQVDTLSINVRPNTAIKHFTAYDPVSRFTAAKAFGRATATCAADFLAKLTRDLPFKVQAIQVDGGSEFMAEFETACQEKGLTLYVLPPKRPDLNGAVERAQGSWRYEFYACHDLPHRLEPLNQHIDAFAHLYNQHRPHGALDGQTPAEYLKAISTGPPPHQSHMS
jgi:putative transposase